ncbi:Ig-like domain-containing protein, partial [Klebsiella pneumoniae]|uniref:Ig-like domain-containing protein n=1 Tax=Klebsiella pneumoniae TaxID=573 RepID=UPI003CCB62AB
MTDDVAQHTGPRTSGGLTNVPTLALTEAEKAEATKTMYSGGTVLGTVVGDEDGHWRFTPDPLGEGEHRLSTTVTDVAGDTSGPSPDFLLTGGTTRAPGSGPQVADDVAEHTRPLATGGAANEGAPPPGGGGARPDPLPHPAPGGAPPPPAAGPPPSPAPYPPGAAPAPPAPARG